MLSNVGGDYLDDLFTKEQQSKFDVFALSYDIGYIKPQDEIYQYTTDKLGVAPENCVFIDDAQTYVDAAISNGMKSTKYTNFADVKSFIDQQLDD